MCLLLVQPETPCQLFKSFLDSSVRLGGLQISSREISLLRLLCAVSQTTACPHTCGSGRCSLLSFFSPDPLRNCLLLTRFPLVFIDCVFFLCFPNRWCIGYLKACQKPFVSHSQNACSSPCFSLSVLTSVLLTAFFFQMGVSCCCCCSCLFRLLYFFRQGLSV